MVSISALPKATWRMKLVTVKVIAEMLGVTVWRVYELARAGQIPVTRIGRSMRFDVAGVEEWARNGGTDQDGKP